MKKTITTLTLLVGFLFSNAQITLDQSNVPQSGTYTETRDYVFSGIALPAEGANQVYDYSSMSLPTTTVNINYQPATRPEFSNSTRYFVGNGVVGPIAVSAEYYTSIDANGLYDTGSYVLPSSQSLQTITGNANDVIVFPGNLSAFSLPSANLPFPATFGSQVSSNFDFVTDFQLTVGAFGLNSTPGQNVQSVVKTVEVVGYGQLTLPVPSGQSIPYDVLMVKQEEVITNNVFLAGAPAPQALLNAFGVTQGQVTTNAAYVFYAENYEVPIAFFIMDENFTQVDQMFYDMDLLQVLSVNQNEFENSISMYPNPASNQVNITRQSNNKPIDAINIYDISGKFVKSVDKNQFSDASSRINIDVSDLSNGTYLVKINSGNLYTTKKMVVAN
jgi:hypothetical protein